MSRPLWLISRRLRVVDDLEFWEVKMVSKDKTKWVKEIASRLAIAAAVKALMMVIADVVLSPHD